MELGIYGWLAIVASSLVALFIGTLIWRHKDVSSGGYMAFTIFAGVPIGVLVTLGIMPMLSQLQVQTPDGEFSVKLKEMEARVERVKDATDKMQFALEGAVDGVPSTLEAPIDQASSDATGLCNPYAGGKSYPSPGLLIVGGGKKNWFPVIASIYDIKKAVTYAEKLGDAAKQQGYRLHVYKTSDQKARTVWAVTLGGYLSQGEAIKRACFAVNSPDFQPDSYVWASDKWGEDVRR